ncbi:MAG: TetR/AcrR family transcriptional regulator [Methanothrix sp.]|jgi:AcrR family transcriptional regulator|nr:TetR/AcrR family transcriptional regulator [Methanothrix sp.]
MKRITKGPEERRQELIDTAERLFMENGYEHTAISDIVKELNVAQGTLYYYFRSKEDILEAVVEKSIADLEGNVIQLISDEEVDEAARLNAAINGILGFVSQRNDFIDFLHQDINAVMHAKLEKATVERIVPILSGLVIKGNANGSFNIENPIETVEFLSTALVYIFHQPDINTDQQRREKLCRSLETILNKVLAARNYKFLLKI